MIEKMKWVVEGDTLVEYMTDKGKGTIPFSKIMPYWEYASADEFEGGRLGMLDDKKTIILTMLVASGQDGVILGWDTDTNELIHISSGAYNVAVDVYDGYVYNLYIVQNFTTSAVTHLCKIPLGVKDASYEDEEIEGFEFSHSGDFTGNFDDIDLNIRDGEIEIRLGGKVYTGLKN